jgi:hypothetical protein
MERMDGMNASKQQWNECEQATRDGWNECEQATVEWMHVVALQLKTEK